MFDQQIREDILYMILYGAAAMLALTACCYLLLRRANAIAPEVASSPRLRRWAAAFFASLTLSHLWYLPIFYLTSAADIMLCNTIGGTLDFMTLFPFAIVVLLSMLQDRRRPLWPVFVMFMPIVVGLVICCVNRSDALLPVLFAYYLLLCIGLIVYMVREVRQYGRWLCDNYADLEHKEIWQSFVVLNIILITFSIYVGGMDWKAYESIIQICDIIVTCFILWRVETLSDLGNLRNDSVEAEESTTDSEHGERSSSSSAICERIAPLLQRYCIDTHLYLQHDLTLSQLARAVGTNRSYLGQYFSSQGTTYNAYINNLRINHFMNICREAVAAHRPFTVQQLANDSGYRSYSTFSLAFKNRTGQSVTAWIRETTQQS